jgi:hypothetical protein
MSERDEETPRPPLTTTTSIKPAATVLIAGAVMLVVFVLINVLFDSSTTTPTSVIVVGGLPPDRTSTLMSECVQGGAPPSDIASGLIVPIHSTATGPVNHHGNDPAAFDCSRGLHAPYSNAQILGFYVDQLRGLGWHQFSSGTAHGGGQQILFQKAGSDTFYWIEGVTTNPSATGQGGWTLRIYQDNSIT